jgi:hypothetical protein
MPFEEATTATRDSRAKRVPRKLLFRLRERIAALIVAPARRTYWRLQDMQIGRGTSFSSLHVSWPHQVSVGSRCRIEHDVYFHFDGVYKPGPSILIGE